MYPANTFKAESYFTVAVLEGWGATMGTLRIKMGVFVTTIAGSKAPSPLGGGPGGMPPHENFLNETIRDGFWCIF